MLPKVLIGCPVRNSEKTIPYYLAALLAQEYPKESIEFCFLVNNSTDSSEDYLVQFAEASDVPCTILRVDLPGLIYNRSDNQSMKKFKEAYARLAKLRNILLDCFLRSDASFYLSVDSDIIVTNPDTLSILVNHNLPIVSGLIRNDYQAEENNYKKQAFNVLNLNKPRAMYEHVLCFSKGLNTCDLTGAIVLIRKDVIKSGARYSETEPGIQGEDQSFCERARELGYIIYVDSDVKAYHAMTDRQINNLAKNKFSFYSDWIRR